MTKLRSIVGLFNLEMYKRGFIIKSIWWWPVINLATLIHAYSYLVSLKIIVGYRKLRSLMNPGQFKCVLEKPDIMYPLQNSKYGISNAKLEN